MSKNKFYAVIIGRRPGIYLSWPECEKQIKGYSNSMYKGFSTIEEANKYLKSSPIKRSKTKKITKGHKKEVFNKNIAKENRTNMEILKAERELKNQRLHYKDKPVNGEPTDKQIDYLKALGKKKNFSVSIIGLNKREAAELINYLLNQDLNTKKPKCFDKYIKSEIKDL